MIIVEPKFIYFSFSRASWTDQHETVSYHDRLVQLNTLENELIDVFDVEFLAALAQRRLERTVVDRFLSIRKKLKYKIIKNLKNKPNFK